MEYSNYSKSAANVVRNIFIEINFDWTPGPRLPKQAQTSQFLS